MPAPTPARPVPTARSSPRSPSPRHVDPRDAPPPRAPTCSSTSATATGGPARTRRSRALTKNGLGLNPYDGAGQPRSSTTARTGSAPSLRLAPGAVVLLNRLCYASGNGEPGMARALLEHGRQAGRQLRGGVHRAGASVVLADGHTTLGYELARLFGPDAVDGGRVGAGPRRQRQRAERSPRSARPASPAGSTPTGRTAASTGRSGHEGRNHDRRDPPPGHVGRREGGPDPSGPATRGGRHGRADRGRCALRGPRRPPSTTTWGGRGRR